MLKNIYLIFLLLPFLSRAQASFPDEVLVCSEGQVVNIVGSNPNTFGVDFTTVQASGFFGNLGDDTHTGVINIGFNFDFYGTTYTQCVASTNGYLTFNTAQAGQYSPWSINSVIPTGAPHTYNAILGPYSDVLPNANSQIDWVVYGTAPNRVLIVIWDEIGMFSCTQNCYYNSIMLFEGSNEIINTIGQYESCSTWNGGYAAQGIVNSTGTSSIITDDPVTGVSRNFPNSWNSTGDAVKYTPNAAGTNYTYAFIPYTTIVEPEWYAPDGTLLAQGYNVNITAPDLSLLPYTIDVKLSVCDQEWTDEVVLKYGAPDETIDVQNISCIGDTDGKILYFAEGGENEDWSITLKDINGNVIGQYNGDNLPIVFDNLAEGVYYIESISPSTCFTENEVLIGVEFSQPVCHAAIEDVLCNGESSGIIQFSPHGGYNEGWVVEVRDQATGTLVGTFSQDDTPIPLTGLAEGDYDVTVNSPSTCELTLSYTVGEPDPFVFIKEEFEHNNCGTFSGYIDFDVSGGVYPYSYSINGKTVIDLQDDVMPAGHYVITATDGNGCTVSRDIDIFDKHSPIVDFDMPEEVNLADAQVTFEDLSVANEYSSITNWLWEFGDTEVSYEQNPTHTYKEVGEYKVYLYATDADGCQNFLIKTIKVVEPQFILPTAFTPNGDGNNEVFRPFIGRISDENFDITISDRWGRIVYTSNNIYEGWDGRDTKGNINEGSYVWIANFKDAYGHKHRHNGIVQLIR